MRKLKKINLVIMSIAVICSLLTSTNGLAADNIIVKGSTTVLPISQVCAEVFMDQNPKIDISVQGGGSGVGISSIIDGTCDIGNASRAIKGKELENAEEKGVEPIGNIVARDAIAVVVNPVNGVNELTLEQIKSIYTGEFSNWSQVGGTNQEIVVISRDSASGTFEAFNELALGKEKVRPDALLQASNAAVATSVANTPGAIGYIGLGYVTSKVKSIKINGVAPSKDTVNSDTYPLARPLFMYTNGEPAGEVKQFINFVMSEEGQKLVEENGYISVK